MSMDATVQIRMDKELKLQVEELYRSMGTSFAEAVRIFAQQSIREGGMPFRPGLKTWEQMSQDEISEKLVRSEADIVAGRLVTQAELDSRMQRRFSHE